ncbi:squalene/phytoene synthase family protein [Sphingomonas sp. RT2P30]|uniref:squalene/phytoene synthase family protein n=1 Tax=Parasphingomonas halimpatiens TaxID=3096162 RepID=UPI002FC60329
MVNDAVTQAGAPPSAEAARSAERALALGYAPGDARPAIDALFALDEALGNILRTGREPLISQMRLTWWHDALTRLDTAPPPAEPILQALADDVLPRGVSGAGLATMVEGWEALLDPGPGDPEGRALFGDRRGGALFAAAGSVLGARGNPPLALAGSGWALADLARHLGDRAAAEAALSEARAIVTGISRHRWGAELRALGALSRLAVLDTAVPLDRPIPSGSPGRVGRLLWHRLTGY